MYSKLLQLVASALLVVVALSFQSAHAEPAPQQLVNALATGKLKQKPAQIEALAATKNPAIIPVLQALIEGELFYLKNDGQVVIAPQSGPMIDAATGKPLSGLNKSSLKKIKANNKVRRIARAAIAKLTLQSPVLAERQAAVEALFKAAKPESLSLLLEAQKNETDPQLQTRLAQAIALISLQDKAATAKAQQAAIAQLRSLGGQQALALLQAFTARDDIAPQEKEAATRAVEAIEKSMALWGIGQNVWYGLSLGSVLLLAAIGLAITFGVMGIINMAHGEMVMLGAYTTFVVQEVIRSSFPGVFEYSLAIALPLAFLVAGSVGFAMERGIIRFLYGRPLETLLATWGVSLVLQQAVRSIFGPTNKQVGNPEWMSGAYELGGLMLTANRLWILAFALLVFALLLVVLRRTRFGLQMRAVTQNRRMAASMGIRTPWVDAFTFALGSGIAGIAGVALSQIANVSPNLGQTYIIDSFMVVVFGGVGNLWGTLVGAMTLGVANKFLEPYAGAVLAKILTLVFIILFIQKRPRGLFAQKGRAVEA
ncbi:urea ABC transporter permease subunit UrtB [Polycladidibacter hongkongensis]|uniref:urea ABC transporter permease subunit UrtB n=1 Tax=Polycladidibacter hongkongensis TaxID=1647556 RepID=UPI00082AD4E9|nr:urea ABC transporter permease subunit UrtB [Pseudovibrio hongkongensis]